MNYRHEFHAGNFADVLKHIILTRILLHLAAKPAPFRYIETHAGSGIYDLSAPEAEKTAEWRGGIGRLAAAELPPEAQALIAPYLNVVAPFLDAKPRRYPGSPEIARALLRRQDRMILCELHLRAFQDLRAHLGADRRAKLIEIDGYVGLKAFIPPVERRGLVLIDPPFEDAEEFLKLAKALEGAQRKWATGIFLLWYPVKDKGQVDALARTLAEAGAKSLLRLELQVAPDTGSGLVRTGLIIVNPPYRLDAEAEIILPSLSQSLAKGASGHLIEWIAKS
ncbi:23S rRNA (adenine(2030)-N(6))-methyltransferase RlmJ [Methylocapsa acidiphila]|uniref:23S rRNA (adenine(2030)-N(6))-methyltransferase RlmJ n=1 Tax=Methylocapsa acidiphila TaxID=133552 RepID=UPI00040E9A3D|nr:23S rRNA (adenine(2030)-N(6))-methyltransferase RlmJ [Methylocapsa acidiphila]